MPLLWVSLSFVAGLLLGFYVSLPLHLWLLLTGITLLAWTLLRRIPDRPGILSQIRRFARTDPRLFVPPILLLAALFCGAARVTCIGPDLENGHIAAYNDQGSFRIWAVVDEPPDRRDQSTLVRLRASQIAPLDKNGRAGQAKQAHGLILALFPANAEWEYGDRLELEGNPETPPEAEDFSYRDYLARQNVYTYLSFPRARLMKHSAGNPILALIYRFRDWAYAEIYHLFPSPEAPLLAGILLGIEHDLPESLTRAFQDTGTAHIIAISGFNIAILSGLFSSLFVRIFSRWWAAAFAIVAIGFYTIMVGAGAAAIRASDPMIAALTTAQIGRKSTVLNALGLTAAVMCAGSPLLPWDASFQLSFGATLGLVLYGDSLQSGFLNLLKRFVPSEIAQQVAQPVGEYLLLTMAAQFMTLPVVLYHFQRLSISSLLANPLILPAQPLMMILSGLAVLAGLVCDPLAHLLAYLAWPLSAFTIAIVEILARIPSGVLELGEVNLTAALFLSAATFIPLVGRYFPNLWKKAVSPGVLLVIVWLFDLLILRANLAAPDGRLRLLIFDLEGSQVVLLRAPEGQTILINSSSGSRLLNDALDRWLSPLDRRLDGVLINNPIASELNGLPGMMNTHPVGQVWWGCIPPDNRATEKLSSYLLEHGIESHVFATGEGLKMGDVQIEVLAATPDGSALRIVWENFRGLIPGGVPLDAIDPNASASPVLLLLTQRDLDNHPLETWTALYPQATIATLDSTPVMPTYPNWFNTYPQVWYKVVTDGQYFWIERSR